jgi:prepilin-type N-terminal cleavage/methylation domain-containing protein
VNRRGFTLLEAMVALVILGLVVVGFLQLFAATLRSARNTAAWTAAVAYAAEGMEQAKLDLGAALARGREPLDGGFVRQLQAQPAGSGLRLISVTVLFPGGGSYTVHRLVEAR